MTFTPSDWRIEIVTLDGDHFAYVPRFGIGIRAKKALRLVKSIIDPARFTARIV